MGEPQRGACLIGTAGWSIAARHRDAFDAAPSGLERYATRFNCVEINSTFYRLHRPDTFRRWADTTPPGFRFSLKLPRRISHELRLTGCEAEIAGFAAQTEALGKKRAVVLVQTPASLPFDPAAAAPFLAALRDHFEIGIAFEPRHPSWFGEEASGLLRRFRVARVAADPPRPAQASEPGGWPGLAYYRLHGSPRIYFSEYGEDFLRALADRVGHAIAAGSNVWCIFDNTAHSHAVGNALTLKSLLAPSCAP